MDPQMLKYGRGCEREKTTGPEADFRYRGGPYTDGRFARMYFSIREYAGWGIEVRMLPGLRS
jgi:hypothetical protein